ncbi:pectate lyase [Bacteroides thetaiotaomicron]|uniref:pectate lyase n=1 Tax=Bacteroides thetaiotaomicron TaxID=818 RepID=UPI00232FBFD1|nr:pectate lyase [Bacteroides thetaiotaomicron]MDC2256118.1 pectate lyase [Bacteroides thetaiotaomicron]MDC2260909.1 pectate lyase [Bacteroides thetaiotaomicron]
MKKKILILGCLSFCLGLIPCYSLAQVGNKQLAFPTAEGYGKYTVGGRGGKVYKVTNLNDSGEGSLRAAVEAHGARTVIFEVSGIIELKRTLSIKNPYITIAGQTAPGDGICLKRYPLSIDTDEVIIRYIRVRLGDEANIAADAVSGRYHKNIILDHLSASWSIDECMSVYRCQNLTVQWCLISESLYQSKHEKGNHGFGGIWGGHYATYHHNMFAHHTSRNPRFGDGTGNNDYRNNVIYNWAYNTCYGGERNNTQLNFNYPFMANIVANYYKPGPATRPGDISKRIANPAYKKGQDIHGKWYIADNYMEGSPEVTKDNWDGGVQVEGGKKALSEIRMKEPWDAMKINMQSAEEAYKSVLASVGASLPKRDQVDARIIEEVKGGYATYEGKGYKEKGRPIKDKTIACGIIDSPSDVGGWPVLKSKTASLDSDQDGIPDTWESIHGLDPNNPSDGNKINETGYTWLEIYLNSLCE